jgi:hypothetical protein
MDLNPRPPVCENDLGNFSNPLMLVWFSNNLMYLLNKIRLYLFHFILSIPVFFNRFYHNFSTLKPGLLLSCIRVLFPSGSRFRGCDPSIMLSCTDLRESPWNSPLPETPILRSWIPQAGRMTWQNSRRMSLAIALHHEEKIFWGWV